MCNAAAANDREGEYQSIKKRAGNYYFIGKVGRSVLPLVQSNSREELYISSSNHDQDIRDFAQT